MLHVVHGIYTMNMYEESVCSHVVTRSAWDLYYEHIWTKYMSACSVSQVMHGVHTMNIYEQSIYPHLVQGVYTMNIYGQSICPHVVTRSSWSLNNEHMWTEYMSTYSVLHAVHGVYTMNVYEQSICSHVVTRSEGGFIP